jgi:SAM-dependent methyltransferase
MSETWNEGYFTDVGYTYGYYRETSPLYQRFCLLLRGLACNDLGATATHCELGFGQGVSVNINAAANPGRYVATDFNPAHAAHARGMASHSGCDLQLHDDSFEQLLARDDLPMFDSISLHGIWTWVGRDNQRTITKFAARHLKPGGVFYISFNCFPGWAAAYPLRQLFALHDRYAAASVGTQRRVEEALKFSGALLAAGPVYALAAPGLDAKLKQIAGQQSDYVAHEYFNREWNCMYFTDVADALADAKLDFATTAEPLDVVDTINLTSAGIAFLNAIEHPILREQVRDYFVNRQFRKDLYLRGVRRLSAAEYHEQTLATRLVLTRTVDTIPMVVNAAQGAATLHGSIFQPLLKELAARDYAPKSFDELRHALPELSLPQLVMAGAALVGADHAAPCHPEPVVEQVRPACDALNRHLLDRARTRADINYLASPVMGCGIVVNRVQQLFLLARKDGCDQPAEWARVTWRLLDDLDERLLNDGKILQTREENLAELTARATKFVEERMPILRAVGIV